MDMDRLIFTYNLTYQLHVVIPTDQGPNGEDLKVIVC